MTNLKWVALYSFPSGNINRPVWSKDVSSTSILILNHLIKPILQQIVSYIALIFIPGSLIIVYYILFDRL